MASLQISEPALEASSQTKGRWRLYFILLALYLSAFIAALDSTVVSTAIPVIVSELHSATGYTWIGGASMLAKACTLPLWAKFSDIWGRKPIILINIGLYAVSCVICALSRNVAMLLCGRALQGVAGGALLQLPAAIISDLFSVRQRTLYLGLFQLNFALSAGVGPLIGGTLAELASWRWIFWMNIPICVLGFLLVLFLLDIHNPRTKLGDGLRAIDWTGMLAIIGLTLMILLALDFGGVIYPWNSPKIVCLLVFGCLLSVVFAFNEVSLANNPLMPLRVFRNKSNLAALAAVSMHSMVFMAGEYFLPLYLQSAKQLTPIRSGILVLPLVLSTALTGLAVAIFTHQTGEYLHPLRLGFFLLSLGTGLYMLLKADASNALIVGVEIIAGAGSGLCFQPPIIAVQAFVSSEDTATATAATAFARNLAAAFSIVIGGVLLQNGLKSRAPYLKAAGLDSHLIEALSGPEAAANVDLVKTLQDGLQRATVEDAYAWSLRNLWILYTGIAVIGGVASLFVGRLVLREEHTEHKTGLKEPSRPEVQA
ncbi:putative MFS transporter [Lasiodiplodia theobromae]|nr:putative MFS transporter [Lasiodiplodia theobromae]